jgi:hypothetical protein
MDYTQLQQDGEARLDATYAAIADLYLAIARKRLGHFNLGRHTLLLTLHGLDVLDRQGARPYWSLRNEAQPIMVEIYEAGIAFERLPAQVHGRLVGTILNPLKETT